MSAVLPAGAQRPLGTGDVRTLLLAALGGALEFYDFVIFVYFANVIASLFFPPGVPEWLRLMQTYGIFAAGYLARPLGGVLLAHFGDRDGRKRMFTLSVLLMALPTLAIGALPTYETVGLAAPLALLMLRLLQGAAIGGEVPGAWVFVAEHLPARRLALACGTLTGGLTLGILLGSLLAGVLNRTLQPADLLSWGWRLAFLAGGIFGLVAVRLRAWLAETPLFEAMRAEQAAAVRAPLQVVLQEHRAALLLSMALTWVLTAAIVVVILMTPSLLKAFGLDAGTALAANSAATLALACACVAYGALADRFGVARILVIGCGLLALAVELFYHRVLTDHSQLLPLYVLAGAATGVVALVPAVMVRSFPTAVRFSGLSFAYNTAYALFGGLTPPLVAGLAHANPLAPGHYVAAVAALGVVLGWLADRQRGVLQYLQHSPLPPG
jgi:MFS family permease